MDIPTDALLTMLLTTVSLVAVTSWALAAYLLVNQARRIDQLEKDIDELDRDVGNLWQVTFPRHDGRPPAMPNRILPFIRKPAGKPH